MKILFIGGNGNISWWCVQKALEQGNEVYELNRGLTRKTRRKLQDNVKEIIADIRDKETVNKVLGEINFDVVCDFICFDEEQSQRTIEIFRGRCNQYIVISSEAVYDRSNVVLPFVETSRLYDECVKDNYIAGKIQVEKVFNREYSLSGFPITIVRPGYTYDTIIQMPIGQNCFTAIQKLLDGYPFLIPGNGENLVAPLHSKDFANAFVGLIGNSKSIGETYHITADKTITWNQMAMIIMEVLGLPREKIVHIPEEEAVKITDFYSEVVNYQHMGNYIFDNSKIKEIVPKWNQEIEFCDGIKETVDWLMEEPVRQRINSEYNEALNRIYKKFGFVRC